jgi:hypothetical protein
MLAPDFVQAVLDGTHGSELSLPRLLEGVPVVWGEQPDSAAAARPA